MPEDSKPLPIVALEGVGVEFGGLRALDDVTLEVRHGEIVGLIGPNGAGKTTLFNIICGFTRPTFGSGQVQGRRLSKVRPDRLAKLGVARTLQGVGLFHGMSVLDNVVAGAQYRARIDFASAMLGIPNSTRSEKRLRLEAMALLERLGIQDAARLAPSAIPYGTQKKASIARALMSNPTLLMLDEPASGLSETEINEFTALFRDLRSDMAILLVEHNMDFVMPLCDRLVVLNFGKVIATGTPAEVREDPDVLEAYLGGEVAGTT